MEHETTDQVDGYQAWMDWFNGLPPADKRGLRREYERVRYLMRQDQLEAAVAAWRARQRQA